MTLLREARAAAASVVVLSIFVNPTQFGPNEDLARYPRDVDGDLGRRAAGTDVAFGPDAAAMYPAGLRPHRGRASSQRGLCGACRPGHFAGVATIVCKLFNIVRPARRRVRREGLPAARDHPAHGARPGLRDRDRRRADRPRGGWAGDVVAATPTCRRRNARGRCRCRARCSPRATRPPAVCATVNVWSRRRARRWTSIASTTSSSSTPTRSDCHPHHRPAVLAVAAFVGRTRLIDNARIG